MKKDLQFNTQPMLMLIPFSANLWCSEKTVLVIIIWLATYFARPLLLVISSIIIFLSSYTIIHWSLWLFYPKVLDLLSGIQINQPSTSSFSHSNINPPENASSQVTVVQISLWWWEINECWIIQSINSKNFKE